MRKYTSRNHRKKHRKSKKRRGGVYSDLSRKLLRPGGKMYTGEPRDDSDKNNRSLSLVGPDLGKDKRAGRTRTFSPLRKIQYGEVIKEKGGTGNNQPRPRKRICEDSRCTISGGRKTKRRRKKYRYKKKTNKRRRVRKMKTHKRRRRR
jgi:hypothetical protein